MASASTPSANEPGKGLILAHTVQLKPMIKAHFSGRMVSSGISDVAIASVHSEITLLKKLMIMIILITRTKNILLKSGNRCMVANGFKKMREQERYLAHSVTKKN